ncbi:MAG: ComF family protein [Thermoanaerobaculia bacterium]|nr:ComF family protein [Thermoanaerobaculia bacterium]
MTATRGSEPLRPLAALRRAVLPTVCLGCDRAVEEERPLLGLCVPCRGRLARCRGRCTGCGGSSPSAAVSPTGFLCGDCRRRRPAYDALFPLYLYRQPLRAVVRHLKFGGLWYLGRHVAELMKNRRPDLFESCDLIVPVPLHWRRRLLRGYNQAEEIARPLAHLVGRPHRRALVRVRATAPQASLGRADRVGNVEAAFRLRRSTRIGGLSVALIDDVATTGRTLDDAARELKRGGAVRVVAAVLARSPLDPSIPSASGRDLERRYPILRSPGTGCD